MAVAEPRRLVAVFGYSARSVEGLHPLCVLRLRHGEELADGAEAVVLSGWSRHGAKGGEAELMRDAWCGPDVTLVCDPTARNTMQNAAAVANTLGSETTTVSVMPEHPVISTLQGWTITKIELPESID